MAWSDAARRAALEVRRLRKVNARLFHGTTSSVKRVLPQYGEEGKRTFLSTDPKDARAFAKVRAMQSKVKGARPVVFVVRASQQPGLRMNFMKKGSKHSYLLTDKPLINARRLKTIR